MHVKTPPYTDGIAVLLREHFQTEESDAGLRSSGWESNPKTTSSPDSAAVARSSSGRHEMHARVRAALSMLDASERNVLALAYGVVFRSRDVDDKGGRKVPRKADRNWRVRLRETYRDLGDVVAVAMASPFAIRSAKLEAKGEIVEWLCSDTANRQRQTIQDEAIALLIGARKSFAAAYEPPNGEERFDAPKRRARGRPANGDDLRTRVLGGIHGREIGR